MAFVVRQGGRTDYNYKEYMLDSEDELQTLSVAEACPGSVAYIVTTGTVYILSNAKEWEEQ